MDLSILDRVAPRAPTYTVFDVNGNAARTGAGQVSPSSVVVQPGEIAVSGTYAAGVHYFKDGSVREYTEAQRAAKAARPDDAAYWDNSTMAWVSLRTDEMRLADKWIEVREIRDRKLADTDWTRLSDVPMDDLTRQMWAVYRQALRDITQQTDPFNIVWPTPPG